MRYFSPHEILPHSKTMGGIIILEDDTINLLELYNLIQPDIEKGRSWKIAIEYSKLNNLSTVERKKFEPLCLKLSKLEHEDDSYIQNIIKKGISLLKEFQTLNRYIIIVTNKEELKSKARNHQFNSVFMKRLNEVISFIITNHSLLGK